MGEAHRDRFLGKSWRKCFFMQQKFVLFIFRENWIFPSRPHVVGDRTEERSEEARATCAVRMPIAITHLYARDNDGWCRCLGCEHAEHTHTHGEQK